MWPVQRAGRNRFQPPANGTNNDHAADSTAYAKAVADSATPEQNGAARPASTAIRRARSRCSPVHCLPASPTTRWTSPASTTSAWTGWVAASPSPPARRTAPSRRWSGPARPAGSSPSRHPEDTAATDATSRALFEALIGEARRRIAPGPPLSGRLHQKLTKEIIMPGPGEVSACHRPGMGRSNARPRIPPRFRRAVGTRR